MLAATPHIVKDSGFRLGSASLKRLGTCHPILIAVAKRAIQITTQDFTVFEGVRTVERQRELMRRGVTRTMNSKHLPQADGMSHAYDLVPWIGGKPVWDWDGCYRIAYAVDRAATEQGVASRIRWGGAWDRTLADFGGSPSAYMAEVQAYRKRRGGRAFLDGVHFELV
jgi:peptidoglycan L-alanyl-D-glutamate endopeptidase CwlK